jgi:DNA-binding protein HU-beta
MNRSELVEAISQRTGLPGSQVDTVLRGFNDVVAQVVAKGDEKITIPGFLSFEQSHRSARTARNPQTGAPIEVPATNTVKVSAGSKLKAYAAGKEAPPA